MMITRRDFLKGLMALTGAAIVGLPETEWAVAESEPLPQIAVARPAGRLGSLRIGDQWYALHDASIDQYLGDPIRLVGEDGHWRTIGRTASSWSIQCEIELLGHWIGDNGERDIEIDTRYRSFAGRGYISSQGSALFVDQSSYQTIEIEGLGELLRL